ncbi:MAG: FadR family transcriptional regulator [Comamonadaceae bacterium]|nr:MAG: FadR family transcriptional regulator [Comamonadaceae bacterium]
MRTSNLSAAAPLVAERLSDRLALRLAQQIESQALRPGDRLPTEQQLAQAHGVSRTVVREAVHQLKSRNLLISRQGSGVYVAEPARNRPLAFDPRVLESMQAVVHVVEVRRVLEGEIAALAAERATRTQIAAMRRALKAIDVAAAAGGDGVEEDLAFHRSIDAGTGNPQFSLLLGFLEQYLREGVRITRGNEARRQVFMDQVRAEHRAVVDAIAAHDPEEARRCATRHLRNSEERLVLGGMLPGQRRSGRAAAAAAAAATEVPAAAPETAALETGGAPFPTTPSRKTRP